ncbi:MAG: redoxin family protein [Bacteroidia bacterium]|jgi:thiol-disulfide isomerase/thioredoxin
MKLRLMFGLVWCAFNLQAQVRQIPLLTLKDQQVYLPLSTPYIVLVFLSPECPLCQNYTLTLNKLQDQFSPQVTFIGIVPGIYFTNHSIRNFKQAYGVQFEIYRDPDKELTKRLGATVTPEVVVLNKEGRVLYQGRIDNWAYEVSRKRKLITQHDLQDALYALLNNKKVAIKKTKAIGCFIE